MDGVDGVDDGDARPSCLRVNQGLSIHKLAEERTAQRAIPTIRLASSPPLWLCACGQSKPDEFGADAFFINLQQGNAAFGSEFGFSGVAGIEKQHAVQCV